MNGKNSYYPRSKISEVKFLQLVRLFALDLTATNASLLTGLSAINTNTIFQKHSLSDGGFCATQSPFHG